MKDYDFDLLEGDYFDTDYDRFVLYARSPNLMLEPKIKDTDGVIWNTYLVEVKYLKRCGLYRMYYKCF